MGRIIIGILTAVSFLFAIVIIEPVFKDFNIHLPWITCQLLRYQYVMAVGLLLAPLVGERLITGTGIPTGFTLFTLLNIALIHPMFLSGCLHSMELDVSAFITYGYGVLPLMMVGSIVLWMMYFLKTKDVPNQSPTAST